MDHGTNARATRSLLVLAAAYVLLVVASVAALILLRQPATLRDIAALNPFDSAESSRQFFASAPEAIRVSGFLCFASAIPLAIYTAIIIARLQCLGVRHAGVYAAFAGGIAAAGGLAAAGLSLWMLSVPEAAASIPVARTLHFLTFLCGGPAFAVGLGLLAGGVSVAGYVARVLPPWVVWYGLAIAATGALSAFGLLSVPMTIAIPVTRVGGFGWLLAVGALLPGCSPRVDMKNR
jgi:hypothetical protein